MRTAIKFLCDTTIPRLFPAKNKHVSSHSIKPSIGLAQIDTEAILSNKSEYRKLCEIESSIPIFSRDWWLDATAGTDGWDVALVKTNGRIIGAMPYATSQRFCMKVINQPPLTSILGPWLLPSEGKIGTKLANEQKIMQSLIDQLPPFDHFAQTWNTDITNWLPFYWNGFNQTTKYTYVLPLSSDTDALWNGLDSSRRAECKKGTERFKLTVRDDLPVDALIALHWMTLQRRGISARYSEDYIRRLDAACAKRNCRKILIAVNEKGRHCAGTYAVWDSNCAYGLIHGVDPEMRNTGALSLCQWETIKHSTQVVRKFNFLGNMNESIEPSVRSFGTIQMPIFSISKTPSRLLRLRSGLLSVINTKT